VRTAERLELGSVPVFFVNGLYLKGPQHEGTFRVLIDGELRRLGVEPPGHEGPGSSGAESEGAFPRTDLPLTLTGTVVGDNPELSLALIRVEQEREAQLFRPGDRVLERVELDSVTHTGAYLRREGTIEYLPFGSGEKIPGEAGDAETRSTSAPPPGGVLRLRRTVLVPHLQDRAKLAESLQAGRLDLEGKRLLKLTRVQTGSVYEMLGLKPRDVILQVNGQWIHDQENPLWTELEKRPRVTLLVMRGGFPKTFVYEID
jgi:type II secretory pathway component PulC